MRQDKIAFVAIFSLSTACTPNYELKAKDGTVGSIDATDDDDGSGDLEEGEDVDDDEDIGDGDSEEEMEEEEEEEEEDFSEYDGAILRILTPLSGDFVPLGEDTDFEAILFGTDGYALSFEDIVWNSDVDMTWTKMGATFEDDTLDVGTHALTAVAELPNGDRLAYTVGGVLVQHEDAGIYVGDMQVSVNAEFEGVPVGTSCIGAATITVDVYGETATGESTCHLDLLGYVEFDLLHRFDYDILDQDLDGDAIVALDLVGFDLPFDSIGSIFDGDLGADWSGSLLGFADFEGNLDVSRISRSVELID